MFRFEQFSPNLECGTDELRSKRKVEIEPIDYRGLMRRARVTDQTAIDSLFLDSRITAPQHSAGESLLDVMVRSGASPRSSDPSGTNFGTLRDAERAMSSRIMVASGAYRALARSGQDSERITIIVVAHNVTVSGDMLVLLREGLNALVTYFGTGGARDPRTIA